MTDSLDKPELYCECCHQQSKDRTGFWRHKQTQKHKKNELKSKSRVKQYVKDNKIAINNFYININISLLLPNGCNMSDCPLPLIEELKESVKIRVDKWLQSMEYQDRPLHIADDNVYVKEKVWYEGQAAVDKLDSFGEKYNYECIKLAKANFENEKLMLTLTDMKADLTCDKIVHKNKTKLKMKPRLNPKVYGDSTEI